ncbi:MAG TPA: hypothetical protein VGK73_04020 [Polyangiaceae bacterium]
MENLSTLQVDIQLACIDDEDGGHTVVVTLSDPAPSHPENEKIPS